MQGPARHNRNMKERHNQSTNQKPKNIRKVSKCHEWSNTSTRVKIKCGVKCAQTNAAVEKGQGSAWYGSRTDCKRHFARSEKP